MQEADLIINAAKVLLMDRNNTCLERASVVVKADQILAVGPSKKLTEEYRTKKL